MPFFWDWGFGFFWGGAVVGGRGALGVGEPYPYFFLGICSQFIQLYLIHISSQSIIIMLEVVRYLFSLSPDSIERQVDPLHAFTLN